MNYNNLKEKIEKFSELVKNEERVRLPGLYFYLPKSHKLVMMQLESKALPGKPEAIVRSNSILELVRLRGTSEEESEPQEVYHLTLRETDALDVNLVKQIVNRKSTSRREREEDVPSPI